MEELGWDERGLGETRAERVKAGVAVVRAEARGEGFEELVGCARGAEGHGGGAAGREGDDGGEGKSEAGTVRHARNLDGGLQGRKVCFSPDRALPLTPISTTDPFRSYIGGTLRGLPGEKSLPRARLPVPAGDVDGWCAEAGTARPMVGRDRWRSGERARLLHVRHDRPVRHRIGPMVARA